MSDQKTPQATIKVFGVEYCFQGTFTGTDLEQTKTNWKNAGHTVMEKPKESGNLYVTRFKTRSY